MQGWRSLIHYFHSVQNPRLTFGMFYYGTSMQAQAIVAKGDLLPDEMILEVSCNDEGEC